MGSIPVRVTTRKQAMDRSLPCEHESSLPPLFSRFKFQTLRWFEILVSETKRKKLKLVLIRARVHPFPFRTRKLSSLLPKILAWRRAGKIGNANTNGQFRLTVFSCQVRQPKELEKSSKKLEKVLDKANLVWYPK